ncbi:hypothetical protein AOCH_003589 [Aspergillus ochraceoroseus]|uniref:DNA-directed DNA polymerase n=1 Tax=Aspergillus ochraceoroseus TaxID=138278 RepID=A0A0F8XN78_9EURO|nr:hypothetical protein AOCH_003589 [Aspergillus ochraceoroseus]
MAINPAEQEFLRPPSGEQYEPIYREPAFYNPLDTFQLPPGTERQYQQQYGDMYFLRLAKLKPAVEEAAVEAWEGFSIAGEHARRVERVLDVRQGELCWVAGTVYMEMPLKPNILDDLTKDNFTFAPAPRRTYNDPSNPESTQIMLEDESGRIRLTGSKLKSTQLATGAVVAILGTENANGDFEAVDIKVPDLARQPRRWEREQTPPSPKGTRKGKIALVSGLDITGTSSDSLTLDLLSDYLLGYTGSSGHDDGSPPDASTITRLIIAGNSIGTDLTGEAALPPDNGTSAKKNGASRKYGYDASTYNASPITQFDSFLAELLPSMPITLMPGENDPANFALPQQPMHRALFPRARAYCAPPPSGEDKPEPGCGQNVDDVLRYLDFADDENGDTNGAAEARTRVMEAMLRWRCGVPTAPDTIWSYPFQTHDPFVMKACPHLFFTGNQPQFKTAIIEGDAPSNPNREEDTEMGGTDEDIPLQTVRLISIPKFRETGELILVDMESLEVEVVKFGTFAGQEEKQ